MNRLGRAIQRLAHPMIYRSNAPYYLMPYYEGRLICPASFVHALLRPVIWEPESRQYLENHLHPGDVAADVGACFGLYTYLFSKLVGPTGLVYAFEPDPIMFSLLRRNVEINHLENVVLCDCAISDKTGTADFYLSTAGASSLEPQRGLRSICHVKTATIDSFRLPRLDWLKVDVEGTEHLVIRGAKETLQRCTTRLLVEFLPQFRNIEFLLQELADYELFGLDHNVICLAKHKENEEH